MARLMRAFLLQRRGTMPVCEECRWFYEDRRETVYRRGRCCFCKRKPFPFSRQYRVGEGSRIDPGGSCPDFQPPDFQPPDGQLDGETVD